MRGGMAAATSTVHIINDTPSSGWDHLASFGPFAVLVAAIGTLGGVLFAQRRQRVQHEAQLTQVRTDAADAARDRAVAQWWARASWALQMATTKGNTRAQEVGLEAIPVLVSSQLAGDEEKRMMVAVLRSLLLAKGKPPA